MRSVITNTVLFFILVGSTVAFKDEAAIGECMTELNIKSSITEHIKSNGELVDETDRSAKCFFHCLAKKIGITDDAGEIDQEKVTNYILHKHPDIDKSLLELLVNSCGERTETDPCEKWYGYTKCQIKTYLEKKKDDF